MAKENKNDWNSCANDVRWVCGFTEYSSSY